MAGSALGWWMSLCLSWEWRRPSQPCPPSLSLVGALDILTTTVPPQDRSCHGHSLQPSPCSEIVPPGFLHLGGETTCPSVLQGLNAHMWAQVPVCFCNVGHGLLLAFPFAFTVLNMMTELRLASSKVFEKWLCLTHLLYDCRCLCS